MILWRLSELLQLRWLLELIYRIDVRGTENVPSSGPCILVANHESLFDPWILCLTTPRRVRFMAKPVGANGQNIFLVDAVMHLDSDGKWRLQSWEVFDPFHNGTTPVTVPEVP